MSNEKRKPGRPQKIPKGTPHNVRCVLVNGEMETFRQAVRDLDMSQGDFSRATVLHAAETVKRGKKPPFDPNFEKRPMIGDVMSGFPGAAGVNGDFEMVSINAMFPDDAFLLRVQGRSMEGAAILCNDLVLVRPACAAEKGQIVVALVDEGLTLKRLKVTKRGDKSGVWLESIGEHGVPDIQLSGLDDRRLVGIYVGLVRKH